MFAYEQLKQLLHTLHVARYEKVNFCVQDSTSDELIKLIGEMRQCIEQQTTGKKVWLIELYQSLY